MHYEKFVDGSVKCIEGEIPFELPEGWAWTRLGVAFSTVTGSTPSTKDSSLYGNDYPFYKPTDLDAGFEVYHSEDSVSERGYLSGRSLPDKSVLVTCIGATIGKTGYIRNTGICNQQINAILPIEEVSSEYIYFCMCSEFEQRQIWTNSSATILPILNKSKFENLLLPIPPKGQQMAIVNEIKELLSFVEIIRKEKSTLQETIKTAKSKILDLAIRGQLVPQNSNDEPAAVLLERIRLEKEELIKQGKIKRDKKESIIFKGEDNSYYEKIGDKVENINAEIPFDLPEDWAFFRLKEIWELISGRDLSPSEYNADGIGVPYITGASNFIDGKVEIVRWTDSPQVVTEFGDLLLTCKGTIGEMVFNDFGTAHIARQIMAVRNIYNLNSKYLAFCMEFYIHKIKDAAKGLIPGISREDILNLILPTPPEQYQRQVVLRVEEINRILSLIEKKLG